MGIVVVLNDGNYKQQAYDGGSESWRGHNFTTKAVPLFVRQGDSPIR